jgi:hypothetical protein
MRNSSASPVSARDASIHGASIQDASILGAPTQMVCMALVLAIVFLLYRIAIVW